MGANISTSPLSSLIIASITDQFNKLTTNRMVISGVEMDCLRFNEIVRFQCPPTIPVDLSHLVTLYALYSMENQMYNENTLQTPNSTKHSKYCMEVTLPQLIAFLSWCCHKCKEFPSNSDRMARLEGLFCVKLWHDLRIYGNEHVLAWFTRLVLSINDQYCKLSHPQCHHSSNATSSTSQLSISRISSNTNFLQTSTLSTADTPSLSPPANLNFNLTLNINMHNQSTILPQSPAMPGDRNPNSIATPLPPQRPQSSPTPAPQYRYLSYVHHDALEPLFTILQPYLPNDSSVSAFMNQLQMTSEQHSLLDIEDEALDDYVPLPVLSLFLSYVVEGMRSMFASISIAPRNKTHI